MPERNAADFSPPRTKKRGSSPMQKTLDEFETTKPLAKRLEGLSTRREPRKRTPLREIKDQGRPKAPKLDTTEPIIIGSSPSASSVSSHGSSPPKHRLTHGSSGDDIFNAPSIESKRRLLLEMDDWVGVDRPAMKSVKMKFADPADRGMIGKRRKISDRDIHDKRRPVGRAAVPMQRPHVLPNVRQGSYNEGDISVRIGSAVDRSDGRSSLGHQSRLSVLSDELLDGQTHHLARKHPLSVPVFSTPGPTPQRFSDRGYGKILTPSDLMGDSSPNVEGPARADYWERHRDLSSSVKLTDNFTSNGIDELHEWAMPIDEKEKAQNDPGSRLVFESTPQPLARSFGKLESSPVIRDFAFAKKRQPEDPLELFPMSSPYERLPEDNIQDISSSIEPKDTKAGNIHIITNVKEGRPAVVVPQMAMAATERFKTADAQIYGDPRTESLTPPTAMATSQIQTEFQNRISGYARLDDGISRTLEDLEKRFARQTGGTLPDTSWGKNRGAGEQIGQQPPEQLQNADLIRDLGKNPGRDFTTNNSTDGTSLPSRARPEVVLPATVHVRLNEQSASANNVTQSSYTTTKSKEPLKAPEDEEAAWRRFVFGDEEESNDYTFEELGAPFQAAASSPSGHAFTQASLVAEPATSPLKQNPHLADATFDASNSTTSFHSPAQTLVSPIKSTAAIKADSTALDSTICSSPPLPRSPQVDSRIGNSTSVHAILPRSLTRHPVNSSLLGEASSASQESPLLPNVSSDELARSPERLPGLLAELGPHEHIENRQQRRRNEPKERNISETVDPPPHSTLEKERVVFRKPSRYVGSRSSDPSEPLVLGERVLRNRRVVSVEITAGKGKERIKGRKKAKVVSKGKGKQVERAQEHERDELGDDDIVDD